MRCPRGVQLIAAADVVAGAAVIAVVDEQTLEKTYDFRAFSTGIGQKWVAQSGVMLGQVADVEFTQMVEFYERTTAYKESDRGDPRLTVVLNLPEYSFADFHATLRIHADVYGPGKELLLSKDYPGVGANQAGKMVGLGAFGQKSAVRQSSLDAFRLAFAQMRPDLLRLMQ